MSERPTPETDAAWHPHSGNGLNEVKEISRKLERERDEARQKCRELEGWKESAMHVLGEWERVWEAAGRPGRLGASKADSVREFILSNNVLNNRGAAK